MQTERPITSVRSMNHTDEIVATLAQAFQDDPALSWIIPDAAKRRKMLPRFFNVVAEQSVRHGEILASAMPGSEIGSQAAALWYPPGAVRDRMWDYLKDNIRLLRVFGASLPRGMKLAEEMYARHPQPQSYTYLKYVGASPQVQGKGWGGAIIRAGIARAAENGTGVLLETATPDNVAIYTRLGFSIHDEWNVPDGGPRFWTMIRPA